MAEFIMISCPLCGMARVLEKTGASAIARGITITEYKGRIRFDHVDLDKAIVVQVREREPGPEKKKRLRRGGGPGFPIKGGHTLLEMAKMDEYQDLVSQMLSQTKRIQAKLKAKGQ